MAVRHAGQEALMHPDSTRRDAHKVWHWRATEAESGRTRVLFHIHIFDDDIAGGVDIVAVKV